MKARVATNYPVGVVLACIGTEFVAYEWRNVPPGFEDEVINHQFLEVQPEPTPEPEPQTTRRRTRGTKGSS